MRRFIVKNIRQLGIYFIFIPSLILNYGVDHMSELYTNIYLFMAYPQNRLQCIHDPD